MSKSKKQLRTRRAARTRAKIRQLQAIRLSVFRTSRHIYAQIIEPGDPLSGSSDKVIVSASTVEKQLPKSLTHTGNIKAAQHIGKLVAERALAAGITKVAFDRSGFRYHGRLKALADAAREEGLII